MQKSEFFWSRNVRQDLCESVASTLDVLQVLGLTRKHHDRNLGSMKASQLNSPHPLINVFGPNRAWTDTYKQY
jgi:hypothetical protein